MSNISQLENVPEISFIENMTLQETEELVKETYVRYYKEKFGVEPVLGEADTKPLLMKAFSYMTYQVMQYIDAKGRAELLKTSTADALDALGALFGLERQGSTRAIAMERFSLAEAQGNVVSVPAGTRVKTADGRYFNTLDYAEIAPGETYVDVIVQAEEPGTESSGIIEGVINLLVDPIPYIASVTNTEKSTGGLDVEDDDSLTERIYLAPSRFSCAGPRDAYEYYVHEWRSDVADVKITSPSPCVIDIYFTLDNPNTGVPRLPTETERQSLEAYLSGETIRPLCDQVNGCEAEEVEYSIEFTYKIATSDQSSAETIKAKVAAAVAEYEAWQRKLGRDINPTELIYRIRAAGAKRVVSMANPVYTEVTDVQLPKLNGTATITYGGLEND